jgi:ABC-2 type transport system permease protein
MTSSTMSGVRGYRRLTLANTFTKALTDRMLLVSIVGVALGAMSVTLGPMFLSLEESLGEMLSAMPESFLALVGGVDMATPAGWYSGEMYSIMVPFAVIYVAVASASKAFAGEVEDGTMGPLIANPVSRTRVAVDKIVAMCLHVAIAATLIGVGTWVGVVVAGLAIPTSHIVAITVHLTLLGIVFGALAALLSILTARRTAALLIAVGLALVAYVWSSFLPLIDSISGLANLSPWYHYIGVDPLVDGFEWSSLGLLAILGILLAVGSIAVFKRRDIPG